jgi:hypothetical protein
MNHVTLRGAAADVRWSYHRAAALGAWTFVADATGGGTVTATVLSHDAFKVSQRPLTFVVPRSSGDWRWAITTLQIDGTSLTATCQKEAD